MLRALAERFPTCATFAFGVGNRAFIGASPERLVTLDGRRSPPWRSPATGTGGDETSDAELAAEMMASPKIRAEHQFVVDDITARLATLGLVGETPVEPDVMRLARVQHLRTPITARVERRSGGVSDMDVIRVANVLHPSPAVGGTPSDPAVEWILANERFDRGWYAAPVGWTDLDGNGELRVALARPRRRVAGATLLRSRDRRRFRSRRRTRGDRREAPGSARCDGVRSMTESIPVSDPVYGPIAAFAGQLAALGVRDVVISPGSRSTPLSLAFHAHPALRTHIQLDERSAGFFALGQAKASGRPSVLICTSGTAAANYLPAVVEANHACVPMIVCTADRPRSCGLGCRTDDRPGRHVHHQCPLGCRSARSVRLVGAGCPPGRHPGLRVVRGRRPRPCPLNWPLRKPLEPVDGVPVREYPTPDDRLSFTSAPTTDRLGELGGYERGVILVGPDAVAGITPGYRFAEHVAELARALAWPVIGEPMSGMRLHDDVVIASAEHLLKHPIREELRPDVVVKLGGAPTTAPVNQWLDAVQPRHVVLVDVSIAGTTPRSPLPNTTPSTPTGGCR